MSGVFSFLWDTKYWLTHVQLHLNVIALMFVAFTLIFLFMGRIFEAIIGELASISAVLTAYSYHLENRGKKYV